MSSANLSVSNYAPAGASYVENLGNATRAFVAALLAVKPETPAAAQVKAKLSERNRMKSIIKLNRLAAQLDSSMPNQAAELRYFATHG